MPRSKRLTNRKVEVKEEVGDLRRARPTRRILEQVRGNMLDFSRHSEVLKGWSVDSDLASLALANVLLIAARGEELVSQLTKLDASGFSPPRKCYTASTTEGDIIQVLEAHREFYSELMEPSKMTGLKVLRKQPGKGGGLVVEAADGTRMRVAIAHVVKTS